MKISYATSSPVNHPPSVVNATYDTPQGTTLSVGAPGLLTGVTDPDGDTVHLVPTSSTSAHGATP